VHWGLKVNVKHRQQTADLRKDTESIQQEEKTRVSLPGATRICSWASENESESLVVWRTSEISDSFQLKTIKTYDCKMSITMGWQHRLRSNPSILLKRKRKTRSSLIVSWKVTAPTHSPNTFSPDPNHKQANGSIMIFQLSGVQSCTSISLNNPTYS